MMGGAKVADSLRPALHWGQLISLVNVPIIGHLSTACDDIIAHKVNSVLVE